MLYLDNVLKTLFSDKFLYLFRGKGVAKENIKRYKRYKAMVYSW
jgi:hypothetical protein